MKGMVRLYIKHIVMNVKKIICMSYEVIIGMDICRELRNYV
jgi:hypothetical protein